jgi:hypothetical protein
LTEEALDRTMGKVRFGRGYGPVLRRNAEWVNGEQGSDGGQKLQETGEHFVMDLTFCTFYHIPVSTESFNQIQCDTQDFNMLGDVNYYKMLQSGGKPLVWRKGVDRRMLYCTTPRNIQHMDSGSIDKHVINCDWYVRRPRRLNKHCFWDGNCHLWPTRLLLLFEINKAWECVQGCSGSD